MNPRTMIDINPGDSQCIWRDSENFQRIEKMVRRTENVFGKRSLKTVFAQTRNDNGFKLDTRSEILWSELSQSHQSQCLTDTYFINSEEMKDKVDFRRKHDRKHENHGSKDKSKTNKSIYEDTKNIKRKKN